MATTDTFTWLSCTHKSDWLQRSPHIWTLQGGACCSTTWKMRIDSFTPCQLAAGRSGMIRRQQATTLKGTTSSGCATLKGGTPSLGHTTSRPLGLFGRSSNRKNASQSSNQEPKHRRVILLALSLHTSFVPGEPNVSIYLLSSCAVSGCARGRATSTLQRLCWVCRLHAPRFCIGGKRIQPENRKRKE